MKDTLYRLVATLLLLFVIFLIIGAVGNAIAQSQSPTPTPTRITITRQQIMDVAATMYCPLCIGERLDVCETPLCRQMKQVIGEKLAAGETPGQIRSYFVQQYGPVVLGEPPRRGLHLVTWLLPGAALLLVGVWLFLQLRNSMRRRNSIAESSVSALLTADDPYWQQLEEELKRW